jgi:hypothetical protein
MSGFYVHLAYCLATLQPVWYLLARIPRIKKMHQAVLLISHRLPSGLGGKHVRHADVT